MFARVGLSVAGVLALACVGGCANIDPPYREEVIAWDPSILGEWKSTRLDDQGRPESTLVVEAREITVRDQRLNPGDARLRPGDQRIEQYAFRWTDHNDSWNYTAYLVESNGVRMLGVQLEDPFIRSRAPLVLPIHFLMRLDTTENTLTLTLPEEGVAWLSSVEWADAPDDGADRPIERRKASRGSVRVAESLDRVVRYHAEHARDEAFWDADGRFEFIRP